jgi:hypothetical protein
MDGEPTNEARVPPFLFPEQARGGQVGIVLAPAGLPVEVSQKLARVLCRVPYVDLQAVSNRLVFVLVRPFCGHYLSPALTRDRSVITFGGLLVEGGDDAFAWIVLPQVAMAVLNARHVCEPPMTFQTGSWLDPETSKVTNERLYQQALKVHRDAMVDLQIDAHFAEKEAAALAGKWIKDWSARQDGAGGVPTAKNVSG